MKVLLHLLLILCSVSSSFSQEEDQFPLNCCNEHDSHKKDCPNYVSIKNWRIEVDSIKFNNIIDSLYYEFLSESEVISFHLDKEKKMFSISNESQGTAKLIFDYYYSGWVVDCDGNEQEESAIESRHGDDEVALFLDYTWTDLCATPHISLRIGLSSINENGYREIIGTEINIYGTAEIKNK